MPYIATATAITRSKLLFAAVKSPALHGTDIPLPLLGAGLVGHSEL